MNLTYTPGENNTAEISREQAIRVFPNLEALDEGTVFHAYREYRPTRGTVELTLYWREPGKDKFRMDAEYDINKFEGVELMPQDVKIVFVGDARRAVQA